MCPKPLGRGTNDKFPAWNSYWSLHTSIHCLFSKAMAVDSTCSWMVFFEFIISFPFFNWRLVAVLSFSFHCHLNFLYSLQIVVRICRCNEMFKFCDPCYPHSTTEKAFKIECSTARSLSGRKNWDKLTCKKVNQRMVKVSYIRKTFLWYYGKWYFLSRNNLHLTFPSTTVWNLYLPRRRLQRNFILVCHSHQLQFFKCIC